MSLTPDEIHELARLEGLRDAYDRENDGLNERIDYLTEKRDWDGKMACPECGSTELGTIEALEGSADCTVYDNGEVEHHGYTDVYWDSSTTVGIGCCCGWEYRGDDSFAEQLKPSYEGSR